MPDTQKFDSCEWLVPSMVLSIFFGLLIAAAGERTRCPVSIGEIGRPPWSEHMSRSLGLGYWTRENVS
jgi:hypothetical protein